MLVSRRLPCERGHQVGLLLDVLAPQGSPEWLYRPWRECTLTDVPEHSTCLLIPCAFVFFGNAE